uniref:Methionine synthase reductase n=1 Tax=Scylla olivacea TaxID=85551 RepID=A0A0P4WEL1_SCYOL
MVVEASIPKVLLLYASQTGNAQAIAESLSEQLGKAGIVVQVKCCSQLDSTSALLQVSCLVVVASTTGDGDPPDSARKLWKQLKKWQSAPLTHLSYTVLGLGDTNYNNFCNFGKSVDKQLNSLGAQSFYRCGWADDGTGLELVVEPWCEGLEVALKLHLSSLSMQEPTPPGPAADGDDSSESVSRTTGNNEELNCNQKYKGPLCENNRKLEMAISSENKDVVSKIMAHYSIDMLPHHEVEHLPLRCCAFPKDDPLSIPVLPAPYLSLTLTEDCDTPQTTASSGTLPVAASQVFKAQVIKIRQLTHPTAVKTALEFTLRFPEEGIHYHPGDTIGILVKNTQKEVELLLGLLGLTEIADKGCELSIIPGTKKRAAAIPSFLPCKSSLRYLLEYCVDIRAVPKKPLLRALAEYTTNPCEQRRLLELVSKEGAGEYTHHVREACLSTLDLLMFFRSCRPSVTTLLEHLPRLLPRPYSAASSPLATPNHLTFVFNVVEIPQGKSVAFSRQGVCTGWLASLASGNCENVEPVPPSVLAIKDVEQALSNLTLASSEDVFIDIYLRSNQSFRPPTDSSTPVVMVGPGTGVAPFLGFLKHRQKVGVGVGEWWLFYGCRHKDKDFLYQNELRELEEEGVLNHFMVSYSRENDSPRYVQDNLIKYGKSLAPLLDKAIVYVCGDANNMAKDVFEAFVSVLMNHKELTEVNARKMITKMQLDKRYLQDVWT